MAWCDFVTAFVANCSKLTDIPSVSHSLLLFFVSFFSHVVTNFSNNNKDTWNAEIEPSCSACLAAFSLLNCVFESKLCLLQDGRLSSYCSSRASFIALWGRAAQRMLIFTGVIATALSPSLHSFYCRLHHCLLTTCTDLCETSLTMKRQRQI